MVFCPLIFLKFSQEADNKAGPIYIVVGVMAT